MVEHFTLFGARGSAAAFDPALDQQPEALRLLAIAVGREFDALAIRIVQGWHADLGRCGDGRLSRPGTREGTDRQIPPHLLDVPLFSARRGGRTRQAHDRLR